MTLLDKITDGCSVKINGKEYKILGKVFYVTQGDPVSSYAKMLLENYHVLVIIPTDKVAYLGKNEGRLPEFDFYPSKVEFNGKLYKQVNHDYQIATYIEFGAPLDVEGEVEFWDYEVENLIISVAVVSRDKKRADVVAKYISYDDIEII